MTALGAASLSLGSLTRGLAASADPGGVEAAAQVAASHLLSGDRGRHGLRRGSGPRLRPGRDAGPLLARDHEPAPQVDPGNWVYPLATAVVLAPLLQACASAIVCGRSEGMPAAAFSNAR